MKNLIKIFAVASAFGLMPVAALAQSAAPAPAATPAQQTEASQQPQSKGAPPSDAISAASQARGGAQPEEISNAATIDIPEGEPSDAQVASSTITAQTRTAPTIGVGQPDGRMGVQDQFTPIGVEAAYFHDVILMPLITLISLLVLVLLLYVIVRYRRAAHPVPSRTTHNTVIEIVWTLVPVLILVAIAVPSIRLLAHQYSPPKADLTVKVIGNQWYWTYQYPDNGDFEIVSNGLSDADAKTRGEPRQLAVDERMVVPAGATVKLIVTSNDVLTPSAFPPSGSKWTPFPAASTRPGSKSINRASITDNATNCAAPGMATCRSRSKSCRRRNMPPGSLPRAAPCPAPPSRLRPTRRRIRRSRTTRPGSDRRRQRHRDEPRTD
jgi:cytochrome c oxidase subunit 2